MQLAIRLPALEEEVAPVTAHPARSTRLLVVLLYASNIHQSHGDIFERSSDL